MPAWLHVRHGSGCDSSLTSHWAGTGCSGSFRSAEHVENEMDLIGRVFSASKLLHSSGGGGGGGDDDGDGGLEWKVTAQTIFPS